MEAKKDLSAQAEMIACRLMSDKEFNDMVLSAANKRNG